MPVAMALSLGQLLLLLFGQLPLNDAVVLSGQPEDSPAGLRGIGMTGPHCDLIRGPIYAELPLFIHFVQLLVDAETSEEGSGGPFLSQGGVAEDDKIFTIDIEETMAVVGAA